MDSTTSLGREFDDVSADMVGGVIRRAEVGGVGLECSCLGENRVVC